MIKISHETHRLLFVEWLKDNDPGWLDVMERTAVIFGPLESTTTYANIDKGKMQSLKQHLNEGHKAHGIKTKQQT